MYSPGALNVAVVVAFPPSKVAECIARRVQGTKFPKPPGPTVVKLDLKFI